MFTKEFKFEYWNEEELKNFDATKNETSINVELVEDEGYWLSVDNYLIFDTETDTTCTPTLEAVRELLDEDVFTLMNKASKFCKIEHVYLSSHNNDYNSHEYYYNCDEKELDKALLKIASESEDIDLEELYDIVKDNDLEVSIDDLIVDKIRTETKLPLCYYEGWEQGDASDEELAKLKEKYGLNDDDNILDYLDSKHSKMVAPAIIEHFGSRDKAVIRLIQLGVKENKF